MTEYIFHPFLMAEEKTSPCLHVSVLQWAYNHDLCLKKSNAKDVPSHLSTSPSCKSVYCLSSQVILPFQCLRWAYNPDVSDAATFLSGFYDGLIMGI